MLVTSPKKLRSELKNYLDLALLEPIRIQRRSGETFILLREEEYVEMQKTVISLEGRLKGMSEALSGEAKPYKVGDKFRLKRFKSK